MWPTTGGGVFPVRRVFCIGKNFADHVAEMGGDAESSARKASRPVVFTKDAACLVADGAAIAFAPNTDDLHHEVELVVAMGPGGGGAPAVWGHAVGLDMTRRDLQAQAKAKGQPWDRAKSFAESAPLGVIRPGPLPRAGASISLHVGGELRQSSPLSHMIWSVEEIVDYLIEDMGLAAGDLVFTGTPAGVGPVAPGDRLTARIEGLPELRVSYRG